MRTYTRDDNAVAIQAFLVRAVVARGASGGNHDGTLSLHKAAATNGPTMTSGKT